MIFARSTLLALCLVICFLADSVAQNQTEIGDVIVAKRDLKLNEIISSDDFKLEQWPKTLIPEGVATSSEHMIGRRVKKAIERNNVVFLTSLQTQSKQTEAVAIPEGMKVIGIKIANEAGMEEIVKPGATVDVVGIYQMEGNDRRTSKTVVSKIKVFSFKSIDNKTCVASLLVNEEQASQLVSQLKDTVAVKLAIRDNTSETNDKPVDNPQIVRDVAKRLDETAADLEDLEMFADADRIREIAKGLRKKVRNER